MMTAADLPTLWVLLHRVGRFSRRRNRNIGPVSILTQLITDCEGIGDAEALERRAPRIESGRVGEELNRVDAEAIRLANEAMRHPDGQEASWIEPPRNFA